MALEFFCGGGALGWWGVVSIYSLKLRKLAPEHRPKPKRMASFPNLDFLGAFAVSFQGGYMM